MIGVEFRPLSGTAGLESLAAGWKQDDFGMSYADDTGTNTVSTTTGIAKSDRRAQIDRAMDWAEAQYGDLLRKLAD